MPFCFHFWVSPWTRYLYLWHFRRYVRINIHRGQIFCSLSATAAHWRIRPGVSQLTWRFISSFASIFQKGRIKQLLKAFLIPSSVFFIFIYTETTVVMATSLLSNYLYSRRRVFSCWIFFENLFVVQLALVHYYCRQSWFLWYFCDPICFHTSALLPADTILYCKVRSIFDYRPPISLTLYAHPRGSEIGQSGPFSAQLSPDIFEG